MSKPRLLSKATLANTFGNTLEWYDFALYGGLAPYIAIHFFPSKNFFISLILTFGAFAAGFLMRPLGGLLYGMFGDIRGRRHALIISVIMMALPTFLLGLIPSYQHIGIAAPVLVVLIRLFQGLSVGGELTGTMAYLTESTEERRRGFLASFSMFGVFAGILIGPIIILIVSYLIGQQTFAVWGWRIPFLFSAVLCLIIFNITKTLTETPAFLAEKSDSKNYLTPLIECFKEHKINMLKGFGISIQVGIAFWITMVYMITYYTKILHLPFDATFEINLVGICIALVTVPIAGKLSEYIGLKPILFVSLIAFIILSIPFNAAIIHPLTPIKHVAILHFIFSIFVGSYLAALPGELASMFPTRVRFTGVALSYNVALALFGGTAPLVVTYLIKTTHTLLAPGVVITSGAVLSLIALLTIRKKDKEQTKILP
ncbi:MAG: hypothetical protein A2298_05175 [Gammaproteobacteria bacterium RIFOXYB2_FULL_38_6]|nr:MAG: hypothetical protein A2298_05175 [Gammaproteobacteria bacterium RIFOXYB2_FULL_38_6]